MIGKPETVIAWRRAEFRLLRRMNAYAERVIGTFRRECFDQVIVRNEAHARGIRSELTDGCSKDPTPLARTRHAPPPAGDLAAGATPSGPGSPRQRQAYVPVTVSARHRSSRLGCATITVQETEDGTGGGTTYGTVTA